MNPFEEAAASTRLDGDTIDVGPVTVGAVETPEAGAAYLNDAKAFEEYEDPHTVRDLRVRLATMAARSGHVFDRTITTGTGPLSPADWELNLVAHAGYLCGFALAAVLHEVERRDPALAGRLLHLVNDVGSNGDDGRCADVWPDVEAKLAAGGVGTPQWDARLAEGRR
jgi:hypothetical protein